MIKPFLSHKREDSQAVAKLRDALKTYGAGGWKDTEDLSIGVQTEDGIRDAIHNHTGGFIWWGTGRILESMVVNKIEIPTAFERRNSEPSYPIVPLFIDLDPGKEDDVIRIKKAVGDLGETLLAFNGIIKDPYETLKAFCRRVAIRYVHDAVMAFNCDESVSVEIRSMSEPTGNSKLIFDWRDLFDPDSRLLLHDGYNQLVDVLRTVREALQSISPSPHIILDQDLPLPLAFLVGHEWRITARLRLTIRQRTGATFDDIDGDGEIGTIPAPISEPLMGGGPVVLVVSCRSGLSGIKEKYADRVGAREILTLHIDGILSTPEIRGLARACADELRRLNNYGIEKHLLMLGPSSLAILAGAASNASGSVITPFWDGSNYVNPISV